MALDDEIAALTGMSSAELHTTWKRVHGTSPPPYTPDLLRRGIAHRLQEKALGGLPAPAKRELVRVARRFAEGSDVGLEVRLTPGTRLKREWQGRVLSVSVEADGFRFEDRRFTSLTSIAREVTGTNWSGPLFFGLKRRARPPRKVADHA